MDTHNSMQIYVLEKLYEKVREGIALPVALSTWSMYLRIIYHISLLIHFYCILEFTKNSKLQDLIDNLSEEYWNYKGFYNATSGIANINFFV